MQREEAELLGQAARQELLCPHDVEPTAHHLGTADARPAIALALHEIEPGFTAARKEAGANGAVFLKLIVPVFCPASAQLDGIQKAAGRVELAAHIIARLAHVEPHCLCTMMALFLFKRSLKAFRDSSFFLMHGRFIAHRHTVEIFQPRHRGAE